MRKSRRYSKKGENEMNRELSPGPSVSCGIYLEWELSRERVKYAVRALSYDRMLQVALGGLIGATRFKMLEGRNIANVGCPKCGSKDSWEHSKECCRIAAPSISCDKDWQAKTDQIMNLLCAPNPALNTKLPATETEDSAHQPCIEHTKPKTSQ